MSTPAGKVYQWNRERQLPEKYAFRSNHWRQAEFRREMRRCGDRGEMVETFLRWPVTQESLCQPMNPEILREYEQLPLPWQEIREDPFEDPNRFRLGGIWTSPSMIHQLFHWYQWELRTGRQLRDLSTIFEFGAGYGLSSVVLERLGFTGVQTVMELPEVNYLAEAYLPRVGCKLQIERLEPRDLPRHELLLKPYALIASLHGLDQADLRMRSAVLARYSSSRFLLAFHPTSWVQEAQGVGRKPKLTEIDNLEYFRRRLGRRTLELNFYQTNAGQWYFIK